MKAHLFASSAIATLLAAAVVSTAGPACAPSCPDSAPEPGSACSGNARCGASGCGTFWSCVDGAWVVGVADCPPPEDNNPVADTSSDAESDGNAEGDGGFDGGPSDAADGG
jgi:hypothetical protein